MTLAPLEILKMSRHPIRLPNDCHLGTQFNNDRFNTALNFQPVNADLGIVYTVKTNVNVLRCGGINFYGFSAKVKVMDKNHVSKFFFY